MNDAPPRLALLPAGLIDLLPPDAEREAALVEGLMAEFCAHGYERVRPPLLEFEDSLLASLGAAVAEQTFRLMDPVSQRMMGLVADTTPQVARIAASRLRLQARPLRLCYAGQTLRVRGSQLAPSRQVPQAGIELFGADGPEADAEVALVAVAALARVGVTGVSLDVTLPSLAPALIAAAGVPEKLAGLLARALDGKDAAQVAALAAAAGPGAAALPALLDAAGPAEGALAALADARLPAAVRAIADRAAAVIAAIRARAPELRLTLDPVEFRGFRYHIGVAFTLFGPGTVGELGRGGRYAPENGEPATGITLHPEAVLRATPAAPRRSRVFVGDDAPEPLLAALRAQGFVTVAPLGSEATPAALRCTHVLRDGVAVPAEKD